jgi:hypothetical protein
MGMALYEALYGRKYQTPVYYEEIGNRKLMGLELVQIILEKLKIIKDKC